MHTLRARCSFFAVLLLASAPGRAAQREAASTRATLDFTPFTGQRTECAELIPVLAGDLVLATTTLRLFAFDSRTAELRWSAGPPDGWDALEPAARDRLFEGLWRRLWVEPAAGERVVVAALQVPMSRRGHQEWQGIPIATALPERRLFAFELGNGRPLWNHAPPPDWDGHSKPHAQYMSLVGSPTVVGERVLAASWSDESSVDYHVSCYELATGLLVWSTFVVRGQMERGMFGQASWEFGAAPLVAVLERGSVLAQTGLGLIAALDLATGAILWRSEYEAIPVPKPRSYMPARREIVWRTRPPIVVGDVVLATPPDSRELLALDLGDGRRLWSASVSTLSTLDPARGEPDIDHLVGVVDDVIYLGGSRPSAFLKRKGMRSPKALERIWNVPTDLADTGRGQLFGEVLHIPRPRECTVLERISGRIRGTHDLNLSTRGMLATDDAIYELADDGLIRLER